MSFGSTLREWRLEADLSQRELARRSGVDFTYLSKIEAELVKPPTEEKIRALIRALGRDDGDAQVLIDLASQTKIAAETINSVLIRNPEVGAFLRSVKDRRLPLEQADTIRRFVKENLAHQERQEDERSDT